jgi:hypothetical protein
MVCPQVFLKMILGVVVHEHDMRVRIISQVGGQRLLDVGSPAFASSAEGDFHGSFLYVHSRDGLGAM